MEAISVYARIRQQPGDTAEVVVDPEDATNVQARNLIFSLDQGFNNSATQESIYGMVGSDVVERVRKGFNATIIAYGQTGSGKTHTMFGPENVRKELAKKAPELGIVPRACGDLFAGLPKGFKVTCSYVEVYNDSINDLLGGKANLPLREVAGRGVAPDGLTYEPVGNVAEVLAAVAKGDARRVVAAMRMNPRSSRGHGVLSLYIEQKGQPHGKLTLVDLAGMESSKKSSAVGDEKGLDKDAKQRREEAKNINISLCALGSVMSVLSTKGGMRVPYRDSKLTRLLQDSLGGNCKCAIVVTLRCEKENVDEAIHTLRFAQRAKAVKVVVAPNSAMRPKAVKLAEELESAKGALSVFEEKLVSAEEQKDALVAEVQTLLADIEALKQDEQRAHQKGGAQKATLERRSSFGDGPADPSYVRSLEAKIAHLEEENRLLRQRDVMHRVIHLKEATNATIAKEATEAGGGNVQQAGHEWNAAGVPSIPVPAAPTLAAPVAFDMGEGTSSLVERTKEAVAPSPPRKKPTKASLTPVFEFEQLTESLTIFEPVTMEQVFHELELTDPFEVTEVLQIQTAAEVREVRSESKTKAGREAKHEWGDPQLRHLQHSKSWKVRNRNRFRAILNAMRLTGTKVSPAPKPSKIPKPKPGAGKAKK